MNHSTLKANIKAILDDFCFLCADGFGPGYLYLPPIPPIPRLTLEEHVQNLHQKRLALRDNQIKQVEVAAAWLSPIQKTKNINFQYSSYYLKEACERALEQERGDHFHIWNGAFILAAVLVGFRVQVDGPNAFFNVNARSLKKRPGV